MAKKVTYDVGDIFEFTLNEDGKKAYGRILKIEKPTILIELYQTNSSNEIPLEQLSKVDEKVLTIWSTDSGIKKGIWKIIGNLPPSDVKVPDFWKIDALTDKIYLIRDDQTIEITKEEIGDAQPYGIFGHEAVRLRYLHELKSKGFFS